MIIFYIILGIYWLSVIAIIAWDELTVRTPQIFLVDTYSIFMPVHNTCIAIKLWKDFNPLNKK